MSTRIIRTGDGRALNSAPLGACFSDCNEIRRWQAHQTAPNALRIVLMTSPAWTDRTRDAVLATTRGLLGDGLCVDLELVEEIPLAPNGKFQPIVPLPRQTAG